MGKKVLTYTHHAKLKTILKSVHINKRQTYLTNYNHMDIKKKLHLNLKKDLSLIIGMFIKLLA